MKLIQRFITQNKRYINPTRINIRKGILHSVGCPQPSAEVFAKLWQNAAYPAHAVLQEDGLVIQTLPWDYYTPHVGAASSYSFGVEMTEPDCIKYTGGSNFTCSDLAAAKAQVTGTYNTAVELFAQLCTQYGLDPLKDILSHNEANLQGIGTAHADPEHLWRQLGMPYTMDGFRKAVKSKMEDEIDMTKDELIKLVDERIETKLQTIKDIGAVPENLKVEVRELLDCEAINGGTGYANNPDDINMPYDALKGVVIGKRYTDKQIDSLVEKIAERVIESLVECIKQAFKED